MGSFFGSALCEFARVIATGAPKTRRHTSFSSSRCPRRTLATLVRPVPMTLSLRTELIQFSSVPYVHTHSVISIAILRALTCDANYMPKHLAEPWQSPGRALLEPCQHPVRTLSEPSGEVPKAGFARHYVGLCSSSIRKWREPNRGHRWVLSHVRQLGYLNKDTVQFTVRTGSSVASSPRGAE